jgi:hypothetical protein
LPCRVPGVGWAEARVTTAAPGRVGSKPLWCGGGAQTWRGRYVMARWWSPAGPARPLRSLLSFQARNPGIPAKSARDTKSPRQFSLKICQDVRTIRSIPTHTCLSPHTYRAGSWPVLRVRGSVHCHVHRTHVGLIRHSIVTPVGDTHV